MTNRQAVLRALLNSNGEHVSGQALAERLGISRPAVWRHIEAFRRRGYEIESEPGRGHRLLRCADVLSAEDVQCRLATKLVGCELQYHEEVGSTNDAAKRRAIEGCPDGAVIVADAQTQGRGRRGREWQSPPGVGLYLSLVLRPDVSPARLGQLSLLMALATARALEQTAGVPARTKWPNDVLIDGRKVAGLLLEADTDLERVRFAVVGIGVNVSTAADQLPQRSALPATSLTAETGRPVRRIDVLLTVLEQAEAAYADFRAGESEALLDGYRRQETCLGQSVQVSLGRQTIDGVARSLGPAGELVVEDGEGRRHAFVAGEVTLGAG